MKDKIIPVFFACDDAFVKFTLVTIRSMLENASKDYHYNIYILNTNIQKEMEDAAFEIVNEYNYASLEFVDVKPFMDKIGDKLHTRDYYSKTTYFRLFIAEMFKEFDKAIYLDSDMIVKGDISKLYNKDLGNNLVGVVHEEAMIQTQAYGDYVEKNLGLDRYNYFNAGMLVINSKAWREEVVLEQFIDLLGLYTCKVTQDEDYLNIICQNRCYWVGDEWNVEIYENIKIPDDKVCIYHYIMWCKPWHFTKVRFEEYFWKYAKMNKQYDDIKAILNAYTDEERKRDLKQGEALYNLALNEVKRTDTFLKVKHLRKSVDRLKIVKKIEQFEREGKFGEDVESDPPTRPIVPGEVDYKCKKISNKIRRKIAFRLARKFLNNILDNKKMIITKINGKENLANLKSGAVITCNHFNALDSFAMHYTYEACISKKNRKKHGFYRVIREGNYTSFPGFYGKLMRNCNTLPLASNLDVMKEFIKSTKELLDEGNFVLVYPEQSMWWNYKKPKPLHKGAFDIACLSNVPVVPIFITMKDSDIVDEDGFKVQEYEINILKPIEVEESLPKKEKIKYLMEENYKAWVEVYENYYHTKLEYLK